MKKTTTKNPFPYSDDIKRYHTYNYYLTHKYGTKVAKIPLDAGFTCPNRDGTISRGGCTYCSPRGSGDFAGNRLLPLREQFNTVATQMNTKWHNLKYIPYFQAYTNTYAPLEVLRRCYQEVITYPNTVGLAIATRADCLSPAIADLLGELNDKTDVSVELGLQTIHDATGRRINRGHSYDDFLKGLNLLTERNIPVCVHLINGLPGETKEDMVASAKVIGQLPIYSLKFHLLHVLENTPLAISYKRGEFPLLTRDEYVDIICDQLEVIPAEIVIQRITGDGKKEDLIGPQWSLKKFVVLNEIDKELQRRNSMQGYGLIT